MDAAFPQLLELDDCSLFKIFPGKFHEDVCHLKLDILSPNPCLRDQEGKIFGGQIMQLKHSYIPTVTESSLITTAP